MGAFLGKTNFIVRSVKAKYSSIHRIFFSIMFDLKEKDFVSSRHPSNWVKHFS